MGWLTWEKLEEGDREPQILVSIWTTGKRKLSAGAERQGYPHQTHCLRKADRVGISKIELHRRRPKSRAQSLVWDNSQEKSDSLWTGRKKMIKERSIKPGAEKFPLCPMPHTTAGGREQEPGLELTGSFPWTPELSGPSSRTSEPSGNIQSKTDRSNNLRHCLQGA